MCLESPTGVRYIFPNDIVPQGNRLAKKRTVQSRDWRLLLQCRAAGGSDSDLGVGGRAAPVGLFSKRSCDGRNKS